MKRNRYIIVSYDEALALAIRLGLRLYDALRVVYRPLRIETYRRFSLARRTFYKITI